MNNLLLIGIGGFMGALLRYGVSGFIQNWFKSFTFPYGTLTVNLMGCLLIGIFTQLAESRGIFSSAARSIVLIGLLGAFTTFSTFGNETVSLIKEGNDFLSFATIGIHLILELSAFWLGRTIISIPLN